MNDPTSHACVLCDAPASAGHHRGCPGADPHAISYLDQRLPDGTKRIWTLAGVQYTGTPARRAAITDLMPTVTWRPAAGAQPVPFMVGALLTEMVPQLGIARWLSHFAYHDDAFVTAPDCGCVDPLRCRCDISDNPAGEWADYQLIGLRVRTRTGWLELWLLDLGAAAVIIAEDDRGDPIRRQPGLRPGLVPPLRRHPRRAAGAGSLPAHLPPPHQRQGGNPCPPITTRTRPCPRDATRSLW